MCEPNPYLSIMMIVNRSDTSVYRDMVDGQGNELRPGKDANEILP